MSYGLTMRLVMLVAGLALEASAGQFVGTVDSTVSNVATRTYRIGSSSSARANEARFNLSWGASRQLRALNWRMGTVHTPGLWTVQLVVANVPVASTTMSLNADEWNSWTLPTPWSPAGDVDLLLTPQGNSEAEFVVMDGVLPQAARYGYVSPGPPPFTGYALLLTSHASLVMVFDGADEFADPTCVGDDATEVTGWPYVAVEEVALDAGETLVQSGLSLGQYVLNVSGVDEVRLTATRLTDAGTLLVDLDAPGLARHGQEVPLPSGVTLGGFPAPANAPFTITIRAVGGAFTVKRLTAARPDAGVCDPIVRATWAGARGFTERLDTDLFLAFRGCAPVNGYVDGDGDGSGAGVGVPICHLGPLSLRGDDCDDADARRAPNKPELCNLIDDDCDALIDVNDPGFAVTSCELTQGVCAGAMHVASECVNGVWQACPTTTYRGFFEVDERSCDGRDNDCDGAVDEIASGPLCTRQAGVCAGSRMQCVFASWRECSSTELPSTWETSESRCDGLDNDCDLLVDGDDPDVVPTPCELQAGLCAGADHHQFQCRAGGWEACGIDEYGNDFQAVETRCDGIDNDCDGNTDGADPQVEPPPCEKTLGVCSAARHKPTECTPTGWSRCTTQDYGAQYEADELTCDGLDNDCDGRVDERCRTGCGCSSGGALAALMALILFRRRFVTAA